MDANDHVQQYKFLTLLLSILQLLLIQLYFMVQLSKLNVMRVITFAITKGNKLPHA